MKGNVICHGRYYWKGWWLFFGGYDIALGLSSHGWWIPIMLACAAVMLWPRRWR